MPRCLRVVGGSQRLLRTVPEHRATCWERQERRATFLVAGGVTSLLSSIWASWFSPWPLYLGASYERDFLRS